MKLEYGNKVRVFDGSAVKYEDEQDYADATYQHRQCSNADIAANASLTITPDNMAVINFISVICETSPDEPPSFNLTLTDATATYTLTGLKREFKAFGAWTAVTIVCGTLGASFEWALLGT